MRGDGDCWQEKSENYQLSKRRPAPFSKTFELAIAE
jgi:hypothetical protein